MFTIQVSQETNALSQYNSCTQKMVLIWPFAIDTGEETLPIHYSGLLGHKSSSKSIWLFCSEDGLEMIVHCMLNIQGKELLKAIW